MDDMTIPAAASIAEVDELDPLVAGLTWALTYLAGKYAIPDKFRNMIPILALLIATGLVAGMQATQGEPITLATIVRGLGAGAAAIAGHSGVREVSKFLSSEEAQTSTDEEPAEDEGEPSPQPETDQ